MTKHDRYLKYKAENKCPNCGGDTKDGFVYCSKCRKNIRHKYKSKVYPDGTKQCIDCGQKIAIESKRTSVRCRECQRKRNNKWAREHYRTHVAAKDKVRAYCRERYRHSKKIQVQNKKSRLERLYGITYSEFVVLLERQNYRCAICGTTLPSVDAPPEERQMLCIDHDHSTGKLRGILCRHCNWGLGNFKDSVKALASAIEYLSIY
jgi:DNA-directed RNA polymerase subunit RPC12/RpoP